MQSIIILGKNKEDLQKKAQDIVNENKISKFDINFFTSEKQIGIGDIRTIQKKIFLTTLKSEKKAEIIEAFLGMTNEAQSAFLKILEEPPLSTIIIILTTSLDFFLPTILSRCNLITIDSKQRLSQKDLDEYVKDLVELKENKIGKALLLAQDNSKTREDALSFLEGLINSTHEMIGKNQDFSDKEIAKMLSQFQKFYTLIKTTNVNVRFALEDLLLNI